MGMMIAAAFGNGPGFTNPTPGTIVTAQGQVSNIFIEPGLRSWKSGELLTPSTPDPTGFAPFLGTPPSQLGLSSWQAAANYIQDKFGPSAVGFAGEHGYYNRWFPGVYEAEDGARILGEMVAKGQAARDAATSGFISSETLAKVASIAKPLLSVTPFAPLVPVLQAGTALAAGADKKQRAGAREMFLQEPTPQGNPMFEEIAGNFDLSGALNNIGQLALQYRAQREQQRLQAQQVIPDFGPMMNGGGFGAQQVAFPLPAIGGTLMRGGTSLLRGLTGAGGAVVAAGGRLVTAAGRIITSKKAVQLAKVLGVQGAATALGIGAVELADAVLADQKRRGRGRGISAADMRRTKRTIRKVMSLHRQIASSCSSAGYRTRRSSSSRSCPPPRVIVTKK